MIACEEGFLAIVQLIVLGGGANIEMKDSVSQ